MSGGFIMRATPQVLNGLEWDGNDTGTNTSRRLLWTSSIFDMYDSTYILRTYPKGPKTNATNPHYWAAFFWGFDTTFVGPYNFCGGHPYPFNGTGANNGQNWEVSIFFGDWCEADKDANYDTDGSTPNGTAEATWNRWYTQVFRAFRIDSTTTRNQFIYDWDLFVSSNGTAGWFQHTVVDASWGFNANDHPSGRAIVVGEAFKNAADDASWGSYLGREQFKGVIRGIQIYNARLGTNAYVPSVANLADVASEIAAPGSIRTPWYLNLNPTPSDVTDKSGSGHHPSFPASLPSLWTGP